MSLIRRRLTEVVFDSMTDYLKERLDRLKELDLDHDGQKDMDEMKELVEACGMHLKKAVESTDFQKLATGLDQIISGTNMLATAVDGKLLKAAGAELNTAMKKLGKLAQLSIKEMKENGGS